jgi:release factor glutamine methyltransferase
VTFGTALRQGTELLKKGGISVPRLTAEVLLSFATKQDRSYLYAHPEQQLREVEWIHYGRYLHERLKHKPTQYITHVQEFYGRDFYVSPDVLIPRPETEHLVEASLPFSRYGMVVDVGTGSGAIAVTLALETGARVIAVDSSAAALSVAERNAEKLDADVIWMQGDALSAIRDNSVTLVVSNPPYVARADRESLAPEVRDWEPEMALFAGVDGLDFHRSLIPEAARVLKPGGHLVLELGAGQCGPVLEMLGGGLRKINVIRDLAGFERVLVVEKGELNGTFRAG